MVRVHVQGDDHDDETTPLMGGPPHKAVSDGKNHIHIQGYETPSMYRSRWKSIRIVYFTIFLSTVNFTIFLPSLWTYLKVLQPDANANILGWVVAAYSIGQLVSAPLFGGWSNARKSTREPLIACLSMSIVSYTTYAYLASLPDHRQYYMLASRCLIGFSAGTAVLIRSYVSGATTVQERTLAMANLNICSSLGFIAGPPPALMAAVSAFLTVLFVSTMFRNHTIYTKDVTVDIQNTQEVPVNGDFGKPDYIAVISCIVIFFFVSFMFQVFETLTTPLTMHMFAWTKSQATFYSGLCTGASSAISIVVYVIVKKLSTRFKERTLLLGGFIMAFSAFFSLIPWGTELPPLGLAPIRESDTVLSTVYPPPFSRGPTYDLDLEGRLTSARPADNATVQPEGCPWNYPWCMTVPAVFLAQYVVANILFSIGFPVTHVLSFTIYSKVLGPRPQGLWMSCFFACTCLAGMMGPVPVTEIYGLYGPQVTFAGCSAALVCCILFMLVVFRRLVPFSAGRLSGNAHLERHS